MLYNLTLLRTFLYVIEYNGFTAAANKLNLSQSTVSHHINRLEELVDQPLLVRSTRSFQLTEEGEFVREYASSIRDIQNELAGRFRQSRLAGNVSCAIVDDISSIPLSMALRLFAESHPNVKIDIRVILSDDFVKLIGSGELDFGIIRRTSPSKRGVILRTDPLAWIGHKNFKVSEYDDLPLSVVNEPCMYRSAMIERLNQSDIPWHFISTCNSLPAVLQSVKAGLGITACTLNENREEELKILTDDDGLPELPSLDLVLIRGRVDLSEAALALEEIVKTTAFETPPCLQKDSLASSIR